MPPPSLSDTALCSVIEAREAALESEQGLQDVFAGDLTREGARIINSASERVRRYLGRDLIAYVERDLVARRDWHAVARAPTDEHTYRYVPDGRPVSALLEPYKSRDVLLEEGEYLFATSRFDEPVEYVAGYRRRGQELPALPDPVAAAVASADVIPTLPADIVRATAQIAVIRARQAIQGLVGQSSVQQDTGEFSASLSLSQADRQAERRELHKINHHRRMH